MNDFDYDFFRLSACIFYPYALLLLVHNTSGLSVFPRRARSIPHFALLPLYDGNLL